MNLSVKIESILLAVAMSLFNKYLSSVPHIFATWKKFEKNAMNSWPRLFVKRTPHLKPYIKLILPPSLILSYI